MNDTLLSIEQVSKKFGEINAVNNLDLTIKRGQIHGLLGPNGSGKSTTLRMIIRIFFPDSGAINFNNEPIKQEHMRKIGYLPEERSLYRHLKVIDQLIFLGELKGMHQKAAREKSLEYLERFDLIFRQKEKCGALSKGMQQKVQLIGCILHSPELLILDEPFSGLDPIATDELRNLILQLKREGTAIILSTHQMNEAEKLCESICLINKGCAVIQGKLHTIKTEMAKSKIEISFAGSSTFFDNYPGIEKLHDHGQWVSLRLQDGHSYKKLIHDVNNSVEIQKIEIVAPTLHEIFVETIGRQS